MNAAKAEMETAKAAAQNLPAPPVKTAVALAQPISSAPMKKNKIVVAPVANQQISAANIESLDLKIK